MKPPGVSFFFSGGFTEFTMMLSIPSFPISLRISISAPAPTARMRITEATPKTTPSVVRNVRSG